MALKDSLGEGDNIQKDELGKVTFHVCLIKTYSHSHSSTEAEIINQSRNLSSLVLWHAVRSTLEWRLKLRFTLHTSATKRASRLGYFTVYYLQLTIKIDLEERRSKWINTCCAQDIHVLTIKGYVFHTCIMLQLKSNSFILNIQFFSLWIIESYEKIEENCT